MAEALLQIVTTTVETQTAFTKTGELPLTPAAFAKFVRLLDWPGVRPRAVRVAAAFRLLGDRLAVAVTTSPQDFLNAWKNQDRRATDAKRRQQTSGFGPVAKRIRRNLMAELETDDDQDSSGTRSPEGSACVLPDDAGMPSAAASKLAADAAAETEALGREARCQRQEDAASSEGEEAGGMEGAAAFFREHLKGFDPVFLEGLSSKDVATAAKVLRHIARAKAVKTLKPESPRASAEAAPVPEAQGDTWPQGWRFKLAAALAGADSATGKWQERLAKAHQRVKGMDCQEREAEATRLIPDFLAGRLAKKPKQLSRLCRPNRTRPQAVVSPPALPALGCSKCRQNPKGCAGCKARVARLARLAEGFGP